MQPHPIDVVELTVRDLDRSVDFYSRHLDLAQIPAPQGADPDGRRCSWLAAGPAVLRLTEAGAAGRPSAWRPDDLQPGFRHIGFKVSDLDERAAGLRDAGTVFHKDPKDVPGQVRITFFFDPDGVLLEFVQGPLVYDVVEDEELVRREHARPAPLTPRFDHVAVTVADPARTASLLGDGLGFGLAGRLERADDPRGFRIDYLHAGDTVLELFSWDVPTAAAPDDQGPDVLGFTAVGVADDDPEALARSLVGAGARPVEGSGSRSRLLLCDGLVLAADRPRSATGAR